MTKLQHLLRPTTARVPGSTTSPAATCATAPSRRLVADGIRGVTANPTIFARAIEGSDDYDEQFAALHRRGRPVEDAYWELVVDDISDALGVLRPVFDASGGTDGFVSVEVAPELARDTDGHHRRRPRTCTSGSTQPNLFVKIPATAEGVPAIQAMIAEGRSINITLIFSLARYAEVIEAYLVRARDLRRRRRRPVDGAQRRLVLRQPGRHRGRPAPRDAIGTSDALGAARPGRGRPGQARLPAVPRAVLRRPLGAPGRPRRAPCSGRCGRRRRPRTPPTPTPSTSTASSGPTPSTPCPRPPSPRSRTTARWPAPSTPTSTRPAEVMRRLAAVGIDMDDVGLHPRGPGRRQLPPVVPARARRRSSAKARQLAPAAEMDWAGWALFGLVATAALTAVMIVAQLAGLHPPRPAADARHHRHRGPRPGPGRRVLHPPRRSARASRSATPPASPLLDRATWWLGGAARPAPRRGRAHRARPAAARRAPADGVDRAGPASTAVLEPPGPARPQLRRQTPVVAIAAHLVYGIALGVLLGLADMAS